MSDENPRLVHTSRITIYRDEGSIRRACIEGFSEPVYFGVHGNIKDEAEPQRHQ